MMFPLARTHVLQRNRCFTHKPHTKIKTAKYPIYTPKHTHTPKKKPHLRFSELYQYMSMSGITIGFAMIYTEFKNLQIELFFVTFCITWQPSKEKYIPNANDIKSYLRVYIQITHILSHAFKTSCNNKSRSRSRKRKRRKRRWRKKTKRTAYNPKF